MRYEEKLRREMTLKGFNQQRLAKASRVSDSEVSRILSGKSQPGLENALRLARAVGVSLDYLADDNLHDANSASPADAIEPAEQEILDSCHEIGIRHARHILETVRTLGYNVAIRRLLEMKPLIEVGDPPRHAVAPAASTTERRATSA